MGGGKKVALVQANRYYRQVVSRGEHRYESRGGGEEQQQQHQSNKVVPPTHRLKEEREMGVGIFT